MICLTIFVSFNLLKVTKMRTSIILIITLCATISSITGQLPNYFPSNNNAFPSSSNFPQFNSGGFQSQSNQPYNSRVPSVPQAPGSYAGFSQPPSAGYTRYPQSAPALGPPQPVGPFSLSFNVNHGVNQPQRQYQSAPAPSYQPPSYGSPSIPQSYGSPSIPQSYGSPSIPQSYGSPSIPQSFQSGQYRPQSYSAPPAAPQYQPSPTPQYNPQPAPQYQPQPAPQYRPQPAPQQSYQSPQNAQNFNPAPVHYASLGPQLQGDYKFGYHTGDGGSFREETRLPDGSVQGAYGFVDADGKQRIVKYTAGKDGFKATGDDVPQPVPVAPSASAPAPQYTPQHAPQYSPSSSAGAFNLEESPAFKSFMSG